jgi:hypothetical protein
MGTAAVEVIGVSGPEHFSLIINSHFETPADHDSSLFPIMHERNAPGIRTGRVAFPEDLQGAPDEVLADLSERYGTLADLHEFVRTVEGLARLHGLKSKELRKPYGNTVEDALERSDGRVSLIGSMREIAEFVTPARLASSRCESL